MRITPIDTFRHGTNFIARAVTRAAGGAMPVANAWRASVFRRVIATAASAASAAVASARPGSGTILQGDASTDVGEQLGQGTDHRGSLPSASTRACWADPICGAHVGDGLSLSRSFLSGSAGITGHLALVIVSMTFLPRALPPGCARGHPHVGRGRA